MSDAQCLIRKLTIAQRTIETTRKVLAVVQCSMTGAVIAASTLGAVRCPAQQLTNSALFVTVNGQDGSYQFGPIGSQSALQASIGAKLFDTGTLNSQKTPLNRSTSDCCP